MSNLTARNATLGAYSEQPELSQSDISAFHVEKIPMTVGREFIAQYHYSGGCGKSAMIWGVFHDNELIGAIAFQTPISEHVRKSIFGDRGCECDHISEGHDWKEHVTELHRLALKPKCPKNTASWTISKGLDALKEYKPKYKAVISFADTSEGHDGTIYQATNALYYGTSDARTTYREVDTGRLRSRRQCGENIDTQEAGDRGWTVEERDIKHRYLHLLPDPYGSKAKLRDELQVETLEYPTVDQQRYGDS